MLLPNHSYSDLGYVFQLFCGFKNVFLFILADEFILVGEFIYVFYSVIKDEGPDNDQDKEPSERISEEPEVVRLFDLFIY